VRTVLSGAFSALLLRGKRANSNVARPSVPQRTPRLEPSHLKHSLKLPRASAYVYGSWPGSGIASHGARSASVFISLFAGASPAVRRPLADYAARPPRRRSCGPGQRSSSAS